MDAELSDAIPPLTPEWVWWKAAFTKNVPDRAMALPPAATEVFVTMYSPSSRIRNGERT